MEEQKAVEKREKGNKKKKEAMDKRKGEEMRAAALKGMASKLITVNYCYLTKMKGHRQHFRRMLVFCRDSTSCNKYNPF